jgi:hypothetical protein
MSEQTKSMNQFLKENEAPTMTVGSASGSTDGSPGPSMKGDWKKYMKGFLLTMRRKIKQGK